MSVCWRRPVRHPNRWAHLHSHFAYAQWFNRTDWERVGLENATLGRRRLLQGVLCLLAQTEN